MNKLFWIVCEDKNTTLYEGRFRGRTRTAAIRFLKATLGVSSLKNHVFSITEIPVPLLREIIAELLGVQPENLEGVALSGAIETKSDGSCQRCGILPGDTELRSEDNDLCHQAEPALRSRNQRKVGNPGLGDDFWKHVRAYWQECRSVKQTAIKFKLSQNSIKTRARREGWRKNDSTD